jgi:hypothetical protein
MGDLTALSATPGEEKAKGVLYLTRESDAHGHGEKTT